MNFAADCLATTGLNGTQLGIGFAVALGAIAVGIVIFTRSWRNRAALALAPLLLLAGIAGLSLTSSTPAQAVTGCETAPTSSPAPIGNAPVFQPIVYGNYNGATPYIPNSFEYPVLDAYTVYIPACFWLAQSNSPAFDQQISATGDGTITYTATGLTAPDTMSASGLITLNPRTFGNVTTPTTFPLVVTATNEFGSTSATYTIAKGDCSG